MTTKNPSKLLEVEASKIVLKDKEMDHEASVQSSYQALESFKRRGLALDFAGVMTFARHDKYVQMLFSHLRIEIHLQDTTGVVCRNSWPLTKQRGAA